MASKEKVAPPPEGSEKSAPPPENIPPPAVPKYLVVGDVVLRFLLFAATVTAVVVMVTSKQKQPISPPAKFNHSPAFIYFVAALSVAGLYSIITSLLSVFALLKPRCSSKLLFHFIIFDVLMLGIVAAATGAAGAVAYLGLKGNSHLQWNKICNVYDKFCRHIGASVAVALFASIILALLIILSAYSLSKKIPK
ncbi:hypothetical protein ACSBR2_013501 [Camellia fascicularis]